MIIDEIQIRVRYGETDDDVINVKTQLKNTPSAKIEFEYEITNKKGEILTTASTILVFVDMKTGRPVKAPKYIMDLIEA